jgi:beta-lactamase class D
MVAEQLEPVQASDAYIRENKVHQAKNIPPQTATNHVKRNASGNAEISWEKPSWTKSTLRATRKGEQLKSEGNLAAPITKVREL